MNENLARLAIDVYAESAALEREMAAEIVRLTKQRDAAVAVLERIAAGATDPDYTGTAAFAYHAQAIARTALEGDALTTPEKP